MKQALVESKGKELLCYIQRKGFLQDVHNTIITRKEKLDIMKRLSSIYAPQ